MKQDLLLKQKLNQTLHLSLSMKNALDILKMDQSDLMECINEIVANNPVIEYTPSADIHQLIQETMTCEKTLNDDLYLQLHTCQKPYDEKVAHFIIESLDEHGFLSYSVKQYCDELCISKQKLMKHLALIRSFEPAGVGAINSTHSIILQLQRQYLSEAEDIFTNYQKELITKDYSAIAKAKHLDLAEVLAYIDDIKECDPFPCRNYQKQHDKLIIPDFEVVVHRDEIEIIPKQIGHIAIEDELETMKTNPALKDYFQEAYYFIDSLSKRNKTLLVMANELIHLQRNYFLYHDELKPCTLMDIAEKCHFHESTVSRTLSNKYFMFQKEVYPVKSLFVSATKDGSSKDSILKAIAKLVNAEDKKQPLADFEIVKQLAEMELYVSRRAIAKYRKQLHIPNSKERKK
ncbi:MAG: RNA polymerase subunit sigma-54 [Erysipelotrichia bacterium]|nr:RNA polymerase subunit sigma-54 [Erysipelotrichia bacterium]NCC54142.1 RNA polymerase subunit sigma-54 [Erysipelotrichia bacterium]